MRYTFQYSDHRNKFKKVAEDLQVDVWEFMDGAIVLSQPSPEALEELERCIKQNHFVLIPEKEES